MKGRTRTGKRAAFRVLDIGGGNNPPTERNPKGRTGAVLRTILERSAKAGQRRTVYYDIGESKRNTQRRGSVFIVVRKESITAIPYNVPSGKLHEVQAHMVSALLPSAFFEPWKNEVGRILRPGGKFFFTADGTFHNPMEPPRNLIDVFFAFQNDPRFRIQLFGCLNMNLMEKVPTSQIKKRGRWIGIRGISFPSKRENLRQFTDYSKYTQLFFIAEKRGTLPARK